MKAILVIDMPDVCAECEFCGHSTDGALRYCGLTQCFCSRDLDANKEKEPWCPLKPMPEKKNMTPANSKYDPFLDLCAIGWNKCIEEIEDD